MHKIGIHTINNSVWGQDPKDLQEIKDWGFDSVDYNGFNNINSDLFKMNDDEYREFFLTIKKNAELAGVEIGQSHAPWRTDDKTEEQRAFMTALVKRSIEGAGIMGCKRMVVHPIMPYGWDDSADHAFEQETYQANKDFLLALLPVAKANNVTVCIENMPSRALSVSKLTALYDLVEEINDENIGLCLDTGHALITQDSPADMLNKCKKWVRALHVHDNHGTVDSHVWPFLGTADWKAFSEVYQTTDLILSSETGCSFKFPKESKELNANAMKYLASIFRCIADGIWD